MIECNVHGISKDYGINKIFENISFSLKQGDRIGLVGQNGCGKTTLMKILMDMEDYTSGSISIRKDVKLGYLEQVPNESHGVKTYDVLMHAFRRTIEIKNQLMELEHQLKDLTGPALEDAMKAYGRYMEEYETLDGYQLETKVNRICQGLNISESMKQMDFNELSGGEKTRVLLGKLLLESPHILLLDEPSNHLDIATIEWLEGFLKEYTGTILIISHDRYFLDKVVNKIFELTPNEMVCYNGNYTAYVEEKEQRFFEELKKYENQQKLLDRIKEQIHRYRVWGAMRDSEVMYKRAKELEKRLEKIEVLDKPILDQKKIKIDASTEKRSGKQVLLVENLEKSYENKTLFQGGIFSIFYQDSLCLMGPNGSGKSTLLKMIMGEIWPDNGTIKLGSEIKIGYLPQQISFADEEKTLVEHFAYEHGINQEIARRALSKMLFTQDKVYKKIRNLSGGEKSKLKLCSLLYEKVNFLILDEPTNHLDISSREELEESLLSFEGTLLFVSHDRYFVEKIAGKIMVIEDGRLSLYPFGYQSFLEEKSKLIQEKTMAQEKSVATSKLKNTKETNKKKPSKVSIAKVEEDIKKLEEELQEILAEMENNQSDYAVLNDLTLKQENLNKDLEVLYAKWEEFISREEDL